MKKQAPNEIQVRIGRIVRAHRVKLGVTQEELAWRADLHRTYLADIERGVRNITVRILMNLAHALQVSVASLLAVPGEGSALSGPFNGDILLVEDSSADAELTALAFKEARITNRLVHVWDGAEALDYLFTRGKYKNDLPFMHPQVILLDLHLPKISGLEVLRQIKSDARTRDIPVVVLTISRSDHHVSECARLGAKHYIVKPVEFGKFSQLAPRLNLRWTLSESEVDDSSSNGPKRKTNLISSK